MKRFLRNAVLAGVMAAGVTAAASATWIWVEGETPSETNIRPHSWYAGAVNRAELSGGDFLAHFDAGGPGRAVYRIESPADGPFTLWVRANPVQANYSVAVNGASPQAIDMARGQTGNLNLAADGAPDLRFIAWANAGTVPLTAGTNTLEFTFNGRVNAEYHGSLDCFVLVQGEFTPLGTAKPDEVAAKLQAVADENAGWSIWNPPADEFQPSPIDLRFLNETVAGERGRVQVRDGRFVLGDGEPVRFWGVNGPPDDLRGDDLRRAARDLAKRGVNLVRIHGAVFNRETGALQPEAVTRFQEVTAAMKAEGIYVHFSIYFPLWMTPQPGLSFLDGYDGRKHPFAALFFNPEFQRVYQGWWRSLLTAAPATGAPALVDDPAVLGVELINEDSYFFWTFSDANVPPPQRRLVQEKFAAWVREKYGTVAEAITAWDDIRLPEDDELAGRLALRPLYDIFTWRTRRDQDTAQFLMESQRAFYLDQITYLRGLGFKGLITASNWTTANNDVLGPLEKYSYTVGDFTDRHGYWTGLHQGDQANWSIRDGHVFAHRSALRFDPAEPGKPREITHPVFDPKYNGLPSMLSETTFNRPNRYRTESPAFYAIYGALQGSDSIIHFAHDGARWQVKPRFFMQPWTLMSPTQVGQFPATALIYRRGLVKEGALMADVHLALPHVLALQGTPLVQSANLDALREADVTTTPDRPASPVAPADGTPRVGPIDPLIHLVGRTRVTIGGADQPTTVNDLTPFIDRAAQIVRSSTGEVELDFGRGRLLLRAANAQGAVGQLNAGGPIRLPALTLECDLDLAAVLLVPLDDQPIATSSRLLLQVMTEEKPTGFQSEPEGDRQFRIRSIGTDPWLIRSPRGTVTMTRPDASELKITPLDANGYPTAAPSPGPTIALRPDTAYYFIEP